MEVGSVLQFLENKSILVTGGTGFLAKIFVEKVLRVQPNVKKIYLLIRAPDAKSVMQRFHSEVISKDLFKVLKEKLGSNFSSFISEKISLVPGDICQEDLDLKDTILEEEMLRELDAVVNVAATTNFDERYDVSLSINTLGAKHVLNFAKRCPKIKVFVQISTAYVCGENSGLILENSYSMGQALNGAVGLDIYVEKKVADEKLQQLQAEGASPQAITQAMKDFGIERAKIWGWPNTYVFTKAMGEMFVGQLKGNMSALIIRPAIITSTFKDPFPGWSEGVRTIDSLVVGYAKGKLTCFLGDIEGVVDVIPADMVVNATVVAMAAGAGGGDPPPPMMIYQVGSSRVRNPMRYRKLQDYGLRYFTSKPWIDKDGKAVKVGRVTVLSSMDTFHTYMALRYFLLLKGLELLNTTFCHYFQGVYTDLNRKIKFIMRLVQIYRPYLFFTGLFDDMNTEKLRMAAARGGQVESDLFFFDPNIIDWEDYFIDTHFPGIVKYIFN